MTKSSNKEVEPEFSTCRPISNQATMECFTCYCSKSTLLLFCASSQCNSQHSLRPPVSLTHIWPVWPQTWLSWESALGPDVGSDTMFSVSYALFSAFAPLSPCITSKYANGLDFWQAGACVVQMRTFSHLKPPVQHQRPAEDLTPVMKQRLYSEFITMAEASKNFNFSLKIFYHSLLPLLGFSWMTRADSLIKCMFGCWSREWDKIHVQRKKI